MNYRELLQKQIYRELNKKLDVFLFGEDYLVRYDNEFKIYEIYSLLGMYKLYLQVNDFCFLYKKENTIILSENDEPIFWCEYSLVGLNLLLDKLNKG